MRSYRRFGGFFAGLTIGGAIIGAIAGLIAFVYMLLILYTPAISLMAAYGVAGIVSFILYVAFAFTVIAMAATIIGAICGFAGGIIVGILSMAFWR